MVVKNQVIEVSPETEGNPTYEIIKKEDIEAAFRDALIKAMSVMVDKLDGMIETASSVTPEALWTWGYTSRWDYDKFY